MGFPLVASMPPGVSVWSWPGLHPKAFGISQPTPAVNRLLPNRAIAASDGYRNPAAGIAWSFIRLVRFLKPDGYYILSFPEKALLFMRKYI